jgi:hypothetical protein
MPQIQAISAGRTVPLGAVNSLYLLRAADAGNIIPPDSLDLGDDKWLFRFPWSDEDGIGPGLYTSPHRRYKLHLSVPHSKVSCGGGTHYLKYERHWKDGLFIPVLSCGTCGTYWTPVVRAHISEPKTRKIVQAIEAAASLAAGERDSGVLLDAARHIAATIAAGEAAA